MSRDELIADAWASWVERWRAYPPAELSPLIRPPGPHEPGCPCVDCLGAIRPPPPTDRVEGR